MCNSCFAFRKNNRPTIKSTSCVNRSISGLDFTIYFKNIVQYTTRMGDGFNEICLN